MCTHTYSMHRPRQRQPRRAAQLQHGSHHQLLRPDGDAYIQPQLALLVRWWWNLGISDPDLWFVCVHSTGRAWSHSYRFHNWWFKAFDEIPALEIDSNDAQAQNQVMMMVLYLYCCRSGPQERASTDSQCSLENWDTPLPASNRHALQKDVIPL